MNEKLLSEKEAAVFVTLQKIGKSLVSQIAKESLINRTAIYHTLSLLIKKGLVNEIKTDKLSYFEPILLSEYENWEKRRLMEFTKQSESIKHLIKNNTQKNILPSKYKFYEGVEGIKNLYNETWRNNSGKEILAITDYKKAYETLDDFLENDYFPTRIKKGIKVLSLLNKDEYGKRDVARSKSLLREMRFSNIFKDLGIEMNIFDNYVALFSFDKKRPTGVLIQNELISNAFRKIFMYIWERSK
ncbi:MAG TPA: helix-turn-helix domain-containing protein [Candidatus Paceibacterota bacterium]